MRLREKFGAILGAISVFLEQHQKLMPLRTSENHFECQLYNRHAHRLSAIEKKLGVAAAEAKELLRAISLVRKDDSAVDNALVSLTTIETVCAQGCLFDTVLFGNLTLEEIEKFLSTLSDLQVGT